MEEGHVGYYDFSQMMEMRLDADAYVAWKNVFDASIVYWNTTDKNYSMFKKNVFNGRNKRHYALYPPFG